MHSNVSNSPQFLFAAQKIPYSPKWGLLSPVHTGDYSRRFRRLSPKTANIAEFGDSLRCGQAIRLLRSSNLYPAT